jgi:spore coat protein U-like protein
MSTSRILAGVSAGVLLALSGGAHAAVATTTFSVTASVAANCTVAASNLAFGAFTGVDITTPTSTIGVNCTGTTPYSIDLDVGSGGGSFVNRALANGTGGTLIYNLYTTAARTVVWGDDSGATDVVTGTGSGMATTNNHTVYGALLAAGNTNAQAGNYSSTINVTVTY